MAAPIREATPKKAVAKAAESPPDRSDMDTKTTGTSSWDTNLENFLAMTEEEQSKFIKSLPKPTQQQYRIFHRHMQRDCTDPNMTESYREVLHRKCIKGSTVNKEVTLVNLFFCCKKKRKEKKEADLRDMCKRFHLALENGKEESASDILATIPKMRRLKEQTRNVKYEEYIQAVPWGIMVGKHGGNEQAALEALARGEIRELTNPNSQKDGIATLFASVGIEGYVTTLSPLRDTHWGVLPSPFYFFKGWGGVLLIDFAQAASPRTVPKSVYWT